MTEVCWNKIYEKHKFYWIKHGQRWPVYELCWMRWVCATKRRNINEMELTKEPIPCPSYTTNTTLHSFADQPHMIVRDVPTKILKQLPDSTMRHFKLQLGIWVRATRPFWTSMPTMLSLLWVMMFASNWAQGCGTRMKNAINYITLAVKFRHIGFAQIVPNRTCT